MILGIRVNEDWPELARIALYISHCDDIQVIYESHKPYSEFDFIIIIEEETATQMILTYKAKFTKMEYSDIRVTKAIIDDKRF